MKILFISPNRIGDAVITCGVLEHLRATHRRGRITVACGPVAEGLFARLPNLDRVIVFDKRRFDLHWLDLWRQVVHVHWDLVVDLRGSGLAFALRARRRAVWHRGQGRMFEQYARALGISPAPFPVVWTSPDDRLKAANLLPDGRPLIALGPTANWDPKIWPADRFAALFERLANGPLPDAIPVVFGGPGEKEREIANRLLVLLPHAIDLCGLLELSEVAACFQRCSLYVGNDSGLMHIAAASETPTVGLFGPTTDRAPEIAPAGRFALWVKSEEETMEALSVDMAFAACEAALDLQRRDGEGRETATLMGAA